MSPFQIHPHTRHNRKILLARTLEPIDVVSIGFEETWWCSTTAPNGITGPLNGIPNRLSYGVFPSDISWIFSQMAVAFHGIRPRPECNSTADVPSLPLRTAPSANPFVSDLCGVDVQWLQDNSAQNFLGRIVRTANSCTTTAYRWLCRDSHPSLKTLWSAVEITTLFRFGHDCTSASSARSPCNFRPQTDITISVFREVSIDTMLTPGLVPLLLAAPPAIHEKSWESIDVVEHSYHQILIEIL